MITLRHSIGFLCNLVHEQTMLSLTSCSQKIYDWFLLLLHDFGFSKKMAFCKLHDECWAVNLESLGLDTLWEILCNFIIIVVFTPLFLRMRIECGTFRPRALNLNVVCVLILKFVRNLCKLEI